MVFSLIRPNKPVIEFKVTRGDLPVHAVIYGLRDGDHLKVMAQCNNFLRIKRNVSSMKG